MYRVFAALANYHSLACRSRDLTASFPVDFNRGSWRVGTVWASAAPGSTASAGLVAVHFQRTALDGARQDRVDLTQRMTHEQRRGHFDASVVAAPEHDEDPRVSALSERTRDRA
jgi:hypothetical protein